MNVAYLKVTPAIGSSSFCCLFVFVFFLGSELLMSFHRHSCPSIVIICIQPRAVTGADAGMGHHVFFYFIFLSNWDGKKKFGKCCAS